jgi:hypothetical protein
MRTIAPTTLAVLLLCSVFASGCRHGGTDSASAVLPTPGVEITQANAQELALLTLRSAFGFVDAADVGSRLAFTRPVAPALLAASLSTTDYGPDGGDVLRAWDDHDGDQRLSAGDSVLSVFHGYADRGKTFDGIVMFEAIEVIGVPPDVGVASGRLSLVDLQVMSDAGLAMFTGSMPCRREFRATVELLQLDLDTDLEVDGATLRSGTTIAFNRYPLTDTFAMLADGALVVDGAPGTVLFATSVPFSGLGFLPDPYAGELVLRGTQRRTIEARVMSLTSLRIQADLDGNGKVDETVMATWPL